MISHEDRDLIAQEIIEERNCEKQDDIRLSDDEDYAFEKIAYEKLMDIYDDLCAISNNMSKYGWEISVSELADKIKQI